MTISKADLALYARSFVDWSESAIGFYVDQYYDEDERKWIKVRDWKPVRWNERQERVLRHLFTLDDDGRLPYQELWWIDIGKSGKTLLQAALAQWFGLFIDRSSEVLLAANSKDQAGVRCFKQLYDSVDNSPRQYRDELYEYTASEIRFKPTGNVARPIPMKSTTQAGSNAVWISFDELWGYEGERARAMMAEMKESPTRNISFIMVTSYPPFLEDKGPLNDTLNYFFDEHERPKVSQNGITTVEGMEDLPVYYAPQTGQIVWWNHEPYPWHKRVYANGLTFIERQRNKPDVTNNHYLRIWEARRVHREDAFTHEEHWDACEDDELAPLSRQTRGEPLVAAVDIGVKGDTSAGVARSYHPVRQTLDLRDHIILRPEHYADADKVKIISDMQAWVYRLHSEQNLLACYYDPSQFMHAARELEKLGVKMIEFTQNTMRITADTAYRGHIMAHTLRNYPGSGDLKQHVMHAVAVERGNGTIRLDKRKTSAHIDAAVADSMCCYGVMEHRLRFERLARRDDRPAPEVVPRRSPWSQIFRHGVGYGRN